VSADRILIRGATLVDGAAPSDILVEGNAIARIAPSIAADGVELIDAAGMIASPGFVNAHHHTWETGLRGIGSDWAGTDYLDHIHHGMALQFSAEDNHAATLFGALAQIDGGTTTLFDWCHNLRDAEMADASIDALEESGIRAVFGHGTAKPRPQPGETPFWNKPHPRGEVERLRKGRLAADDRLVTMAMAILGPDLGTYEVCVADIRLARELGLLHSAHTWGRKGQRRTPDGMRRLAAEGLLGPDHNVVHGNNLDDEELKLILDTGATVTATPLAEMLGADRVASLGRVARLGGEPSLGADLAPHFSASMLPVIRHALLHQREADNRDLAREGRWPARRATTTTRDALRWGTLGGAKALRLDRNIGALEAGKRADLVLIRTDSMHMQGIAARGNPAHAIVMYAEQADIDTVLIDGKVRKRGGKLAYPAASLDKLRSRLLASRERILPR
jgi:5-methylthioadenosine/S-adenosylhomocysteine deaminase